MPGREPAPRREAWELAPRAGSPEFYSIGGKNRVTAEGGNITVTKRGGGTRRYKIGTESGTKVAVALDPAGALLVVREDSQPCLSRIAADQTQLMVPTEISVTDVKPSPDGRFLSLETVRGHSLDAFVAVLDMPGPRLDLLKAATHGKLAGSSTTAWSPDSRFLAYCPSPGTLRLHDPTTKRTLKRLQLPSPHPVVAMRFSPTRRWMVIIQRAQKWAVIVTLWDRATGRMHHFRTRPIEFLAFSADERTVLLRCAFGTGSAKKTEYHGYDVPEGRLLGSLDCGSQGVLHIGPARDRGTLYLVCGTSVREVRADTLAPVRTIRLPGEGRPYAYDVSPTRRYLFVTTFPSPAPEDDHSNRRPSAMVPPAVPPGPPPAPQVDHANLVDLATGNVVGTWSGRATCRFTSDGTRCTIEQWKGNQMSIVTLPLMATAGPLAPARYPPVLVPAGPEPRRYWQFPTEGSRVDFCLTDQQVLASLQFIETGRRDRGVEWIMWTPDLYYMRSAGAHSYVRLFRKGARIPLKDLDATWNRPDLVEKALRGGKRPAHDA